MFILMSAVTGTMFAIRLLVLHRVWQLPLKHGEGFFLGQRVAPGFYREGGKTLLRKYRGSLIAPAVLDLPLCLWLVSTHKLEYAFFEQWLAMVVTLVVYNLIAVHFSSRAMTLLGDAEKRPATAVLSMAPRRLRDYANPVVEGVVIVAIIAGVVLIARGYVLMASGGSQAFRGGVAAAIWILYLQAGLLLLKGVFIRWRMPLPAKRTEDFRRWRSAWLSYHLKLFDAVRLLAALGLLSGALAKLYGNGWSRPVLAVAIPAWVLILTAYIAYIVRESRKVVAVEREVKPIELVKEFPRRPIPDGRFLAGGLLYFNRDNPGVVVRSEQGIAINLAHPSTYLWVGYFAGLAMLLIWMAR
jgi:uncharacterized membrane protein